MEGLICYLKDKFSVTSDKRQLNVNVRDVATGLHQSYLRWIHTQGLNSSHNLFHKVRDKGWLIQIPALHKRRAPDDTCTRALTTPGGNGGGGKTALPGYGRRKGCGGVVRAAPAGLVVHSAFPLLPSHEKAELAFQLGCHVASVTHGHPSAVLPAGMLAAIISRILSRDSLAGAIMNSVQFLRRESDNQETLLALQKACVLADDLILHGGLSTDADRQKLAMEHIHQIGEGWEGHEALAIAVYSCCASCNDFGTALYYAVRHRGDSDSTGAIAGNIMGALLGEKSIPERWKSQIELTYVLREVAEDLTLIAEKSRQENWEEKYPTPLGVVRSTAPPNLHPGSRCHLYMPSH
ncbi:hypothetical protein CBR_g46217 [Chara braunii]|uniref:ADP-ribosylhydrolase ARH3 n=1 Tax=Chara braunii TaxID=69332 RepID=A0A388K3Q9_CHABU|nr:hypothetical protein CBR_g46217 [Chara braunii]|eukprot:GBG64675.1 hypothetical protein CBR_g46217 [Chara braunii]